MKKLLIILFPFFVISQNNDFSEDCQLATIEGFIYLGSYGGSSYYGSNYTTNINSAESDCNTLGGELAILSSEGELDFLCGSEYTCCGNRYFLGNNEALEFGNDWSEEECWILTDIFNDSYPGFDSQGYHNFILEIECQSGCVYESIEGFNYGGYFQGSHYYVAEEESTWTEANDNINALGIGHFVAISSQEENDFITSIASILPPNTTMEGYSTNWPSAQVWIGLFSNIESGYTGIYEWVNGEELIYDNWNNMGPLGDPAGILISYDGWNGEEAGVWNDGLIDSGTTAFSILELECHSTNDDIDGDGILNINDDDIDGDGIINIDDSDMDGDGLINSDDSDMDGDNIMDNEDGFFPIDTFIQDCANQITPEDTDQLINLEDLFWILQNWLQPWPLENE